MGVWRAVLSIALACGCGARENARHDSESSTSDGDAETTTTGASEAGERDAGASEAGEGEAGEGETESETESETGASETGASETGETGGGDRCEPSAVIVGCEQIRPPTADVSHARGILVEADRAVLTFADVHDPPILCEEADLMACNCPSWTNASRFTIDAALTPGAYGPESVTLLAATGDCDAGGPESEQAVMMLEITLVTDTCVAGRVQLAEGEGFSDLPNDFGFVAPRCL